MRDLATSVLLVCCTIGVVCCADVVATSADATVAAPIPTSTPGSRLLWLSHNPMTQYGNMGAANIHQTDDGGVIASWSSFDINGSLVCKASYIWPCGRVVFTWNTSSVNAISSRGLIAVMRSALTNTIIEVVNISTGNLLYQINARAKVVSLTLLNTSADGVICDLIAVTSSGMQCYFSSNGTQLWGNSVSFSVEPAPAIPVTLSTARHLLIVNGPAAVDQQTGKVVWQHVGGGVVDLASVSEEVVSTVVSQSTISAYRTSDGRRLWTYSNPDLWPEAAAVSPMSKKVVAVLIDPSTSKTRNTKSGGGMKRARSRMSKKKKVGNNYPSIVAGLDFDGNGTDFSWSYTTDFTVSRVGIIPYYGNATVPQSEAACFVTTLAFQGLHAGDGTLLGGYGPVQDYGVMAAPVSSRWDHNVVYFVMAQLEAPENVYIAAFKLG